MKVNFNSDSDIENLISASFGERAHKFRNDLKKLSLKTLAFSGDDFYSLFIAKDELLFRSGEIVEVTGLDIRKDKWNRMAFLNQKIREKF